MWLLSTRGCSASRADLSFSSFPSRTKRRYHLRSGPWALAEASFLLVPQIWSDDCLASALYVASPGDTHWGWVEGYANIECWSLIVDSLQRWCIWFFSGCPNFRQQLPIVDQHKKFSVELWLCSLSAISSATEDHQQLVLRGVSVRHKEFPPLRMLSRISIRTLIPCSLKVLHTRDLKKVENQMTIKDQQLHKLIPIAEFQMHATAVFSFRNRVQELTTKLGTQHVKVDTSISVLLAIQNAFFLLRFIDYSTPGYNHQIYTFKFLLSTKLKLPISEFGTPRIFSLSHEDFGCALVQKLHSCTSDMYQIPFQQLDLITLPDFRISNWQRYIIPSSWLLFQKSEISGYALLS
ncbi:hypothetical protein ZIOFF_072998 [Zingiber officinale]|uniref:Uncharacterized protein n=1 Tax=Zingiber officinale TaxID=94328 RepID=A0A8J5C388_ZINOF|nr:hypothetical protein ZIOFF_072998 [Zingiber officinale]